MPAEPPSHDPNYDRLIKIIFSLAEEVAVLSEQLLTQQKLLESKGILAADEVQNYVVSEQERVERLTHHKEFVERVLASLSDEVEGLGDVS